MRAVKILPHARPTSRTLALLLAVALSLCARFSYAEPATAASGGDCCAHMQCCDQACCVAPAVPASATLEPTAARTAQSAWIAPRESVPSSTIVSPNAPTDGVATRRIIDTLLPYPLRGPPAV